MSSRPSSPERAPLGFCKKRLLGSVAVDVTKKIKGSLMVGA